MNNKKTIFITRTAILLALTIVFQTIGRPAILGPYNTFIVGPLVNASLLVATASVGLLGGTVIAVLAPVGAYLTGAPIVPLLIPIIAAGNFLIILGFYLLRKKRILGILLGSLMKYGFLFFTVRLFVQLVNVPAKKASALIFSFSWPQLVTALTGGIIALAVLKILGKYLENERNY